MLPVFFFFFFNDTATTEIYTLSLHDALPICERRARGDDFRAAHDEPRVGLLLDVHVDVGDLVGRTVDRKSTRLNSSHSQISYAVFCLKKKKINTASVDDNSKLNEPYHILGAI